MHDGVQGDYQLELLPPEGRGAPICVQGYQSNCNTHAVLTEGALLDENGQHLYPIQGPSVTLHSHFGSSQALGRGIIKRQSQFRIRLAGLVGYFPMLRALRAMTTKAAYNLLLGLLLQASCVCLCVW